MSPAIITTLPVPSFAGMFSPPALIGPPQGIMLYGLPGTRKTSIAGSIIKVPGFKKGLFIDVDNGSEVLANDPEVFAAIQSGALQILKIDPLDKNAKAKIDAVVDEICTTDFGYDFVVFDTLDVGQDVAEKVYKAQYATSGKGGKQDGFAIWGDLGVWTDELVRRMHNSPFFLSIITVHAKEQTKDDGAYRILPKLSGGSKDAIGGVPSIVAYLDYQVNPNDETKTPRLVATVGVSDKVISKNRYNLPHSIVDFTLPGLYAQIEANRTAVIAASTKEEIAA